MSDNDIDIDEFEDDEFLWDDEYDDFETDDEDDWED